jgi:hypothetical protein
MKDNRNGDLPSQEVPSEIERLKDCWYSVNPVHENNADDGHDMFWTSVLCVFNKWRVSAPSPEKVQSKKFDFFQNHGNEDGNRDFTICYGDPDDLDNVIVGAEDTAEDAAEAVKRLNAILTSL